MTRTWANEEVEASDMVQNRSSNHEEELKQYMRVETQSKREDGGGRIWIGGDPIEEDAYIHAITNMMQFFPKKVSFFKRPSYLY